MAVYRSTKVNEETPRNCQTERRECFLLAHGHRLILCFARANTPISLHAVSSQCGAMLYLAEPLGSTREYLIKEISSIHRTHGLENRLPDLFLILSRVERTIR